VKAKMPAAAAPMGFWKYYEEDAEAKKLSAHLFKLLDQNGSGSLTTAELQRARTIMMVKDEGAAGEASDGAGHAADTNGDGRVDAWEWADFMGSMYCVMGRKQFRSAARTWVSRAEGHGEPARRRRTRKASVGKGHAAACPKKNPSGCAAVVAASADAIEAAAGPTCDASMAIADTSSNKSEAAKHDAATTIQKTFRGRQSRKSFKHLPRNASNSVDADRLTTLSELWDLMTLADGSTAVGVNDIAMLFKSSKETGLDMMLARLVPMKFEDVMEPEDLSPGEVAHLCMLLITEPGLSEEDLRSRLDHVKSAYREQETAEWGGNGRYIQDDDAVLNLKHFRKLLALVASLMRIDIEYVVCHMASCYTGIFEATDTLVAHIKEQHDGRCKRCNKPCSGSTCGCESETSGPDLSVLHRAVNMNIFSRLVYASCIVDPSGRTGLAYPDLQLFWQRANKNMPELLHQRALKLKRKVVTNTVGGQAAVGCGREGDGIHGKAEFVALLEELYRTPPLNKQFASPLHMCVRMLQRCIGECKDQGDGGSVTQHALAAKGRSAATTYF